MASERDIGERKPYEVDISLPTEFPDEFTVLKSLEPVSSDRSGVCGSGLCLLAVCARRVGQASIRTKSPLLVPPSSPLAVLEIRRFAGRHVLDILPSFWGRGHHPFLVVA